MNFGIIFWLNFTKNERVGQVKTLQKFSLLLFVNNFHFVKIHEVSPLKFFGHSILQIVH